MTKKNIVNKIGILLLFFIALFLCNKTYASVFDAPFWNNAYDWLNGTTHTSIIGDSISNVVSNISLMIEVIGTIIITIATIVLGIRYMLSSAEGKAMAKDSLVSLLVACILFFGWSNIQSLLISGDINLFLINRDFDVTIGKAYSLFVFFAQIVAIIIILYFGIKYIFNGAQGKADLKGKSVQFIIGMILAFSAVTVLKVVSDIINSSLT